MVGTTLSVATFLLFYALILAIDGKERNINTARLSSIYTIALAVTNSIVQSIWFYWLVDNA